MIFHRFHSLALAGALLVSSPLLAQSSACDNATSQSEMTACAGTDFKRADAKLNASYSKLMKSLSPASQARLKTSQRAWIAFRDAECLMRSSGDDGGSVAPMIRANCASELTQVRTKDLVELGSCEEGDLSCPR